MLKGYPLIFTEGKEYHDALKREKRKEIEMGNKKSCTCGYWNQEQQECLYSRGVCIRDEDARLEITEDWIEDKALEVFVFLNILKPSKNDIRNVKTFIRSFVRVA